MTEFTGKIFPIPIEDEVKTAYLNYAMSVIVSRALPDVRDGLKPVHRRLLFTMQELGLSPTTATKKSARVTGDALGKYHPHGEISLYDSLVRMARDFTLRYPLVQGQGNFGSIDGDPPAASRYTEVRLARIGEAMLLDMEKETVDFTPNYDDSLKEPSVLPSAIPNLIVNGSSGIAVGMATNMAPHNLKEVSNAIASYIDNPQLTNQELLQKIKGPDFPTGGIIYGRKGFRNALEQGRGKIVVRGKFRIETLAQGREQIIFTEIPYEVNKSSLMSKIAELIRDKVLDGVSDLRDESNRDGIRIVIELKKGAMPKLLLNLIFAHTDLESNFNVINMAIVGGQPKLLPMLELIKYYVEHRVIVVRRRSEYELRKAQERALIVRGLLIALANIDEVVRIIKSSKDSDAARTNLESSFNLERVQAQAILDMRLARLTSLEISKLEAEIKELEEKISYLLQLLASEEKIKSLVKKELLEIAEKYGDERKTEIVEDEAEVINIEDLIKREEMVILISKKGYVKRIPASAYKNQARGGKGSNSAALIEDDFLERLFVANTHDHILFISSLGKGFWLKVYEIPEASRTARGSHIKGLLAIGADEEITAVLDFSKFSEKQFILMGTHTGIIKKVATIDFANAKTRGIIAIKLDDKDALVSACLTSGNDEVMLITKRGQALRIGEQDVRVMGRASRGVTGIKLSGGDELVAMIRVHSDEKMLVLTEYGYGKRVNFDNFTIHGRATRGQIIYDSEEKTGELAAAISVRDNDDIVVITSLGKTLKIKADTVSTQGKSAKGVRILNIDKPDFVIGLDKVVNEESI